MSEEREGEDLVLAIFIKHSYFEGLEHKFIINCARPGKGLFGDYSQPLHRRYPVNEVTVNLSGIVGLWPFG